MSALPGTALAVVLSLAIGASAVSVTRAPSADMDRTVRPGDDFYRYANGGWLKMAAVQAGGPADTRSLLIQRARQRVRNLIQQAASAHAAKGSVTQKVGDYYTSLMDADGIEAMGL